MARRGVTISNKMRRDEVPLIVERSIAGDSMPTLSAYAEAAAPAKRRPRAKKKTAKRRR